MKRKRKKRQPQQLLLLEPDTGGRRDCVFRRKDSRYWQARFWIGDTLVRRSTGAMTRRAALDGLRCWRLQYERRGAPPQETLSTNNDL